MTRVVLRALAVLVAVAGVIDPAIARRVEAPLPIEIQLPAASHPDRPAAEVMRRELLAALGDRVSANGADAATAIVAVGSADVSDPRGRPVFAVPLEEEEGIRITAIDARPWTPPGQAARVAARLVARGLSGTTSDVRLEMRGVPVATLRHTWTSNEESFDATFEFVPPSIGLHRVRIVASAGAGEHRAVADAAVNVRDERLRVLAYDARPTWPVTFVRRTLESDAMFDVASTSRTSRPVVATTRTAPAVLSAMDDERYDVLLVGALDDLRPEDLRALERFVTQRGGTAVLLPDRQVPAAVRRQFSLPDSDEVLLENPTTAVSPAAPVRASELLVLPDLDHAEVLATAPHAGGRRPVVVAFHRGEGQVILSGLLDAYRYRADDGFDLFWRSVVADAALGARPAIDLRIAPVVARPGERVRLRLEVPPTRLGGRDDGLGAPAVAAELRNMTGNVETVRLWPGRGVGVFEGEFAAPVAGGYTVRATVGRSSTEMPMLLASDTVAPAAETRRALEYLARVTGGSIIRTAADAWPALSSVGLPEKEAVVHPMRSPWWILPFAGLLAAEWVWRRRTGLK